MQIRDYQRADRQALKRLYREVFPAYERKPLFLLFWQLRQGAARLFVIEEDGFAGFAFVLESPRLVMLDYLAVDPNRRGAGLGGRTLAALRELYNDRTILLDIERLDPAAPNARQRERRKAFYLANGFVDSGLRFAFWNSEMELLLRGAPIRFDDYLELMRAAHGRLFCRLIRLRELPSAAKEQQDRGETSRDAF